MHGHFDARAQRYYTLDALRGIAAILVLLHHASERVGGTLFQNGYLAVDFFFMLSGFVIAFSYQCKLVSGSMGFREFVIVRLIRLYPMIALGAGMGTTVFLCSALRSGGLQISTIIASILTFLCVPTTYFGYIFPANRPFWSLFFELCVNFVFAALTPISGRRTIAAALALSFVWLCISMHWEGGLNQIGWKVESFIDGIPRTAFSFFLGVCVYHISRTASFSLGSRSFWLSLALLCCTLTMPFERYFEANRYCLCCIAILFPALILIASRIKARRIENRLSEKLGDLSYPLYASHYPMLAVFVEIAHRLGIGNGVSLLFASSTIAILVNLIFVKLWDVPARRFLKNKLLNSRAPANIAAAAA